MRRRTWGEETAALIRGKQKQYFGIVDAEYLDAVGLKRSTYFERLKRPEDLTLAEFRRIAKAGHFANEDILSVIKG